MPPHTGVKRRRNALACACRTKTTFRGARGACAPLTLSFFGDDGSSKPRAVRTLRYTPALRVRSLPTSATCHASSSRRIPSRARFPRPRFARRSLGASHGACPDAEIIARPMADGGEGTLDAVLTAVGDAGSRRHTDGFAAPAARQSTRPTACSIRPRARRPCSKLRRSSASPIAAGMDAADVGRAHDARHRRTDGGAARPGRAPLHDRTGRQQHERRRRGPARGARTVASRCDRAGDRARARRDSRHWRTSTLRRSIRAFPRARSPSCRTSTIRSPASSGATAIFGPQKGVTDVADRAASTKRSRVSPSAPRRRSADKRGRSHPAPARPADWASRCSCWAARSSPARKSWPT